MADTTDPLIADNFPKRHRLGLYDDWATEDEMVEESGKSKRWFQRQRAARTGPPWARDGKGVIYHVPGYRDWLMSGLVKPVRATRRG
jgi:hypothetical protein